MEIALTQFSGRRKIILAGSALILSGCAATVQSTNYSAGNTKLSSVVIWDTGGLSEEFSTLLDRMQNTATALQQRLEQSKVASKILTTKRMDVDKQGQLQRASVDISASHVLRLSVTKASKSSSSIAVEYFEFVATLEDISTQKKIWSAQVSANFYSQSAGMAADLFARLKQDGLVS